MGTKVPNLSTIACCEVILFHAANNRILVGLADSVMLTTSW